MVIIFFSLANGVITNYAYDAAGRLDVLEAKKGATALFKQDYGYDDNGNITSINDGTRDWVYGYDRSNQLTSSEMPVAEVEDAPTPGTVPGHIYEDYGGKQQLDFSLDPNVGIHIDIRASSIGLDFGQTVPGIKVIRLVPDAAHQTNRLHAKALALYVSDDNITYAPILNGEWSFAKDQAGVATITLNQKKPSRYLKIHVKFDDRLATFLPAEDKAQFFNALAGMIEVYQESDTCIETFQYDLAGNRTLLKVKLVNEGNARITNYEYYSHSDRLKTDGQYNYTYDNAGNLICKTAAGGSEHWDYEYDVLNRLIAVKKNDTIVSEYKYDPMGIRVWKRANGQVTHYVFEGTEPIYEKKIGGTSRSYVYALGRHLARVEGAIGGGGPVYYYHTDHLGSLRVVTDASGTEVWRSDYRAFGKTLVKTGEFDEGHGFTGKEYDEEAGLYYFNARWYDEETGRFISEDPVGDPNSPNLYAYCANNPLIHIDPTGLREDEGAGYNDQSLQPGETYTYTQEDEISPDVTRTTTYTTTVDDSGDVVTTANYLYQKDGGGTLSVTSTYYNYGCLDTTYEAKDADGNTKAQGNVSDGNVIIGLRGWGSGQRCTGTETFTCNDAYNDMFIVLGSEGSVNDFSRVNLEGTTASGYYIDSKGKRHDLSGNYPTIADTPLGETYTINAVTHSGYYALSVDMNGKVPTIGQNPVYPERGDPGYAKGVHIHQGGNSWSYSQGCLTVYKDDWNRFISLFPVDPVDTYEGSLVIISI